MKKIMNRWPVARSHHGALCDFLMRRTLLTFFCLGLAGCAVAPDTNNPGASRIQTSPQVLAAAQDFESACATNFETLRKTGRNPTAELIGALSPPYCPCVADKIRLEVTPEMLEPTVREPLTQLVASFGRSCGALQIQQNFVTVCRSWVQEFAPNQSGNAGVGAKLDHACVCMEKPLKKIKGEEFQRVMEASLQDLADYEKSPETFSAVRPHSIFPLWRGCVDEFRR